MPRPRRCRTVLHKGLRGLRRCAAPCRFPCSLLEESRSITPEPVSKLARRASPLFGCFKMPKTSRQSPRSCGGTKTVKAARAGSAFLQAAEQPDLSGMVNVVERHAVEHAELLLRLGRLQHPGDRFHHGAVFLLEQLLVRTPRGFGGLSLLRPREEIAAFENKRAALAPFKPPANGVLPVGHAKRQFPNVVPA